MTGPRGGFDLVGHNIYPPDAYNVVPINNIVINPKDPGQAWIGQLTRKIGPWRAKMRSTYIRWALSINGLDVASKKYDDPTWRSTKKFVVTSLRTEDKPRPDGSREVKPTIIAEWDGATAAEAHRKTMPMLAAFGVVDLYATLEEFVFDVFKVYINAHPKHLLEGEDFRELRRLRREAESDESKRPEWEAAWSDRLEQWQRKKLYDGLGKVFRSFCASANITAPSFHRYATAENWAETIDIIAIVRNSLAHGVSIVTAELAAICKKPHAMTFDFEVGKPLTVYLYHLQGVDLFCEQLLTAINCSLVEKVYGPMPSPGPEPPSA